MRVKILVAGSDTVVQRLHNRGAASAASASIPTGQAGHPLYIAENLSEYRRGDATVK